MWCFVTSADTKEHLFGLRVSGWARKGREGSETFSSSSFSLHLFLLSVVYAFLSVISPVCKQDCSSFTQHLILI